MKKQPVDPVLRLLLAVADGVGEDDLKSLKFLVSGMSDMNIQELEKASTTDLIFKLREVYDMSFLGELLREIGRVDLSEKLKTSFDAQSSHRLPEVKLLMFHIAQSMSEPDLRKVAFCLGSNERNGKGFDRFGLMRAIETRKPVRSLEDLRQVTTEFGLSQLFDRAVGKRAAAVRHEAEEVAKHSKPVASVARMPSFCDETGCEEGCPYRALWLDKFPHKSTPVFNDEHLFNHEDLSTDGEDTTGEPIGEGAFGKVYKGQCIV